MVLVAKSKKRSNSIHHKRRTGSHHKHDRNYTSTYWPYLPLAIIVGIGMLFNTFWAGAINGVLGYATNTSISGLLQETNSQRAGGGLAALGLNSKLNAAAQAKANDMASRNYWSHNTPEGNPPWVFISNAGYAYTTAGENLAYGFDSSSSTVTGWMNSAGHRANIMNSNYTEVGFGFADSADYQSTGPQTIVVAMYAAPDTPAPAPAPAPTQPKSAPKPLPVSAPVTPAAEPPAPTEEAKAETNVTVAASEEDKKDIVASVKPVSSQPVSRIQLLTNGTAPWSVMVVSMLAAVCVAIFIFRHGVFWHRALVRGERFIIKHHLLDIALIIIGVLGFILTRSAGMIH